MVRAGHALTVPIVQYLNGVSPSLFFFLPPFPPICSREALCKDPHVTGIFVLPAPDWFRTCGRQQEIVNTIAKSCLSA
jgi:hypothetical protein